jgi:hypothetical protein
MEIYTTLKDKARELCAHEGLLDENITIAARTLSSEEAIGNPEDRDFPLHKGNERLMQAEFRGARGQAFTDMFGNFSGSLKEIFSMALENNFRRAVFVASLNAVLRSLGHISGTVHCRDEEPRACADALAVYLRERCGHVRITLAGFQPRMIEALAREFPLRVLDLDPDNIGAKKFGIVVEGPLQTAQALDWADLLLVTGTVLVNGTIGTLLTGKPVLFYGTTIAGAAYLMGWERFCHRST